MSEGNDRPIFIGACPRSGTTLLQLMLHGHPRIAIPPETRFFLPTYTRRLSFGDLRESKNRAAVARFILRDEHRIPDLALDPGETRRRIKTAPPTIGSLIGTVFQSYADRFEGPRWGSKWPPYHRYIEVVMRLFPDAQIIHIVRDPRDCVGSLKRMPWWTRGVYHAIATWAMAVAHMDEAARRWPGSVTLVQYERLVADPERELMNLAVALGEEYHAGMAETERTAVVVPDRLHWHANVRGKPTTKMIGRWRDELEPWEVALCERVLAKRMARFGYEPSTRSYPRPDKVARYYRVLAWRTRTRNRWLSQDREKRWREPNPVAARLTPERRRNLRVA